MKSICSILLLLFLSTTSYGLTMSQVFDNGTGSTYVTVHLDNTNDVVTITGDREEFTITINNTPYTLYSGGSYHPDGLTVLTIHGNGGNDTITYADYNSVAQQNQPFFSISGGDGDDIITTGQRDDYVDGGNGTDAISTRLGEDVIYGGSGDDIILSGGGNDRIIGDAGYDVLYTGPSPYDDTISSTELIYQSGPNGDE